MSEFKNSIEYDLNHSDIGLSLQEKYKIKNEFYRSDMSRLYFIEDKKGSIGLLKIVKLSKNVVFDLETAMKLNHESISKIIEHGCSDKYLYLVKEYVEGVDLEQYVLEKGKLSQKEADVIIKKIGKLLKYLHGFEGKSVVYRDLKPSNIILTANNDIVLIDIITLRTIKEDKDTDTFYIGSRGFSAPEQYGYSQSTAASDIYALGATLYYLLTAKVPNNNESLKIQIKKASSIDENFAHVIIKAMSFNPASRFASVEHMIKALDRNHKGLKKIKILSLSALLIILIFTGWQYKSAEANLQTIETNKIPEIGSGLDVALTVDNYLKISFDRNQMDDDLKDYKYFEINSSIEAFDASEVSEQLFNNLVEIDQLETYTETYFASIDEQSSNVYIVLYDINLKALGFYIYNDIELNELVRYDDPSQVSLKGLSPIKSGINFKYEGNNIAETIIDKENMPEALKDFKYMTVVATSNPYEFSKLKEMIYWHVMDEDGISEYNISRFVSRVDEDDSLIVLIFDERKKPIGYYLNNELKSYEVLPEQAIDQLLIEDCVNIEIFKDHSMITVDESKVEAFTKMGVGSINKGYLDDITLSQFRASLTSGQDLNDYSKTGVWTGYGSADNFMDVSWYVALLNDDFEIIREFKINE